MEWGIRIILSFQDIPGLTSIMQALSFLGHEPFYLFVLPAVYWCLDPGLGRRLAVILIASGGLNGLFKIAFHLPRPGWIDPRIKVLSLENSYGLPSGHAMNAVSLWGYLAARSKKWRAWVLAFILIFLISLSRLYLGVHFPTDLLAGWILGGLFLWAFLAFEPLVTTWLNRLTQKQQVSLTVGFALLYLLLFNGILIFLTPWLDPAIWSSNAVLSGVSKSGGAVFNPHNPEFGVSITGMILGLGLSLSLSQSRLKDFQTDVSWGKKGLRLIIGLSGLLALAFGLRKIIPFEPPELAVIMRLLRYAVLMFWTFYLAPRVFVRTNL